MGGSLFPGLDRECVLKAVSLRFVLIFCDFGEAILDPFGTNRCKKSEWLKQGCNWQRVGLRMGVWVP